MAGAAICNTFALKSLPSPAVATHRQLTPLAAPSGVSFNSPILKLKSRRSIQWSSLLRVRAVADDDYEWAGEDGEVAVEEVTPESGENGDMKQKLIELLYGTDRGLKASSETRAEVVELITQIEAKNPTPAPTEALSLLNGKWILAYTMF